MEINETHISLTDKKSRGKWTDLGQTNNFQKHFCSNRNV